VNYKKIIAFIRLTRPLFLLGGVLLCALGTAAAMVDGGKFAISRFLLGQLLVTAIQLMTHYCNEYYDQEGDRLNTARTWLTGGSGVLASENLSPGVALNAARLALLASLFLIIICGSLAPVVFLVAGLGLFGAWFYTAPPIALVRRGWGEFSASLIVAGMVPLVGYAMQMGGQINPALFISLLPLILIHFAMLIVFQIPDQSADAQIGKRTLCVRLGVQRVAWLHHFSLFIAFCVILVLTVIRWPGARLAWLSLPLAIWQVFMVRRSISSNAVSFTWLSAGALSLFAFSAVTWFAGYALIWMHIQ
jgi:1,4-dihydroxy-2-naphthoate octaprenyltransferase